MMNPAIQPPTFTRIDSPEPPCNLDESSQQRHDVRNKLNELVLGDEDLKHQLELIRRRRDLCAFNNRLDMPNPDTSGPCSHGAESA